ncbi:flagellar motor protein MotA [Parasulfuritortus cantonensis]|uniref:Flagellar motor protein MotA n=1 Tax=Parasulfuritortus cantonensis TaxID=2528202 RepID=A0A4R1BMG5_9PROT|nr:MotA/TolQ/ExbB proton channel family protein [Parasulfuritortus cantonensis]TCJ18700.1 flagellar motor protein MotA [Parasulfuritortus cantonensis]
MSGDFSILALYGQATGVVQAVVLLLVAASLVCWAVIIEKTALLRRLYRQADAFERQLPAPDGLAGQLGRAGAAEAARPRAGEPEAARRERIEGRMREDLAGTMMAAERRLSYLATTGSAAPFVGLFGTVWGIMHAFIGIAERQDTSLAAVAPGIAEALAATAVGLVAAIPAAIAYNKLAGDFGLYARRMHLAIARRARRLAEPEHPA